MSCLAGGSGRRRLDSAGVVGQPGQRVLQPQPSVTVQPFPMPCLETWTLSPKHLQLGFSGEARWPGPGVLELTSSLLSLPLFSYSSAPQTGG